MLDDGDDGDDGDDDDDDNNNDMVVEKGNRLSGSMTCECTRNVRKSMVIF